MPSDLSLNDMCPVFNLLSAEHCGMATSKHRIKCGPVSIPTPLNVFHWLFTPSFLKIIIKKTKQTSQSFIPLMEKSTVYCVLLLEGKKKHNMATKSPHNRAVFEVKPFYIQPISLISPRHNGLNWLVKPLKLEASGLYDQSSGVWWISKHTESRLMHKGHFAGVYLMKAASPRVCFHPQKYKQSIWSTDKMRTE